MHSGKRWLLVILLLAFLLRVYKFGQVPISLHGDEVGVGFNAYTLLTEGVDEYGFRLPIVFRADIPPLNYYVTAVVMGLLGKTDTAIRFPGLMYGMGTLVVVYLLTRKLFDENTGLLATLVLAVNPWHIQISRIAHEGSLGVLLQVAGGWLFLVGLSRKRYLDLAMILWGLSLYAYHGPRLTTPLLLVWLLWVYRKRVKVFRSLAIVGLFCLPLVWLVISRPLLNNRLAGINIFIREETLAVPRIQAGRTSAFNKTLFHNPLLVYGMAMAKQYFTHLNWEYLFFDSSGLRYFNVSRVGLFLLADLPLLLTGIHFLLKSKRWEQKLPLWWILIAPFPGMITLGPPNPGRYVMLTVGAAVTVAVGIIHMVRRRKILGVLMGFVYVYNVGFFCQQYFVQAQHDFYRQWNVGMKEVIKVILPIENQVQKIVMSETVKQPYIFLLWYGNKNFAWIKQVGGTRHHFIGYSQLGKYEFRTLDWREDRLLPNTLLVGTDEEIPATAAGIIKEVVAPDGRVILRIVKTSGLQ